MKVAKGIEQSRKDAATEEENLTVVKIVPPPESLQITHSKNKGPIKCTESGCNHVASSASMLGLHRAKQHNIQTRPEKGVIHHYHCPAEGCNFSEIFPRHFKALDDLRTHYTKLHSEKKFVCQKCDKGFGLERDYIRHEKDCGKTFCCPDCGKPYTNKSSLLWHCNVTNHKKPQKQARPVQGKSKSKTPQKKSRPTPPNKAEKRAPPVILPKPLTFSLPADSPGIVNNTLLSIGPSLSIQTEATGLKFIMTNAMSKNQSTQAVQTIGNVNENMNTVHRLISSATAVSQPSFIETSTTGIQTAMSYSSSLNRNIRIAQTQTGSLMQQAKIPVVKICRGTQKSPFKSNRGKRKRKAVQSSEVQTSTSFPGSGSKNQFTFPIPSNAAYTVMTDVSSHEDKEVQMGYEASLHDLSTMSTQTNLSCLLNQLVPVNSNLALHKDSHTQTSILQPNLHTTNFPARPQSYFEQSIQTEAKNMDQNTQTQLLDRCSDQITQTLQMPHDTWHEPCNFIDTVHSHSAETQTNNSKSHQLLISDNQTQTNNSALLPSYSTIQSEMFNVEGEHPLESLGNDSLSQVIHGETTGLCNVNRETTIRELADYLMNETDVKKQISCGAPSSSFTQVESIDNINPMNTFSIPAASNDIMTQTLENIAMDSMTQTTDLEDYGWEMGTQTMEDLVSDTMTQTSDDLLELLTNNNHTQTVDSWFDQLMDDTLGDFGPSTKSNNLADNSTQIDLAELLDDNSNTNNWTFPVNRAVSPILPTASSLSLDVSSVYDLGQPHCSNYVQTFTGLPESCSGNGRSKPEFLSETVGTQINTEDLNPRESSETQTLYDPLFSDLEPLQALPDAINTTRYLESSQTQTTFDFLDENFNSSTETGDQCHEMLNTVSTRETTECQTTWEDLLQAMESSETQTYRTMPESLASAANTQTQTMYTYDFFSGNDLTDSFTQTNIDQITQTNLFDF